MRLKYWKDRLKWCAPLPPGIESDRPRPFPPNELIGRGLGLTRWGAGKGLRMWLEGQLV